MTFYLVKHSDSDYQLHNSDGSTVSGWDTKPSESQMAYQLTNGWQIVTDGWCYRDFTIEGETVPW